MNEFFDNNNIKIKTELSNEKGEEPLEKKEKLLLQEQIDMVKDNPIIKEVFRYFKNYTVETIKNI